MRVLIPIRTAEDASTHLPRLEPFLRSFDADVVILSAVSPVLGVPPTATAAPATFPLDEQLEAVEVGFADVLQNLRDQGLQARVTARGGAPVQLILETAETEKVDLIAMTVRDHGMVWNWLSGNITQHVARDTTRPLLICPWDDGAAEPVAPPDPNQTRELLVPLDGDYEHQASLQVAGRLAKLLGARITLLHDLERSRYDPLANPDGAEVRAMRVFEHARDSLSRLGIEVKTETCEEGDPAVAADERAKAGADLIVVGTHGKTGLVRLLSGSVAERLMKKTSVPMIVVPADASELAPSKLTLPVEPTTAK